MKNKSKKRETVGNSMTVRDIPVPTAQPIPAQRGGQGPPRLDSPIREISICSFIHSSIYSFHYLQHKNTILSPAKLCDDFRLATSDLQTFRPSDL